jgi:hypothetical protein
METTHEKHNFTAVSQLGKPSGCHHHWSDRNYEFARFQIIADWIHDFSERISSGDAGDRSTSDRCDGNAEHGYNHAEHHPDYAGSPDHHPQQRNRHSRYMVVDHLSEHQITGYPVDYRLEHLCSWHVTHYHYPDPSEQHVYSDAGSSEHFAKHHDASAAPERAVAEQHDSATCDINDSLISP